MYFDIKRIGISHSLTCVGVTIVWRLWQKLDNGDSQGWQRILYNPFYIIHVLDWLRVVCTLTVVSDTFRARDSAPASRAGVLILYT